MPEEPEVRITSEIINALVKGKKLLSITKKTNKNASGFSSFVKELPLKVKLVECKGKLMYFIFCSNKVILSSFGLTGEWTVNGDDGRTMKYEKYEFVFDGKNKIDKSIKESFPDYNRKKIANLPHKSPIELIKSLVKRKVKNKSDKTNKEFHLYYTDQLNFGSLIFADNVILNKKLKTLGIDPLLDQLTKQEFIDILDKINKRKNIKGLKIYEFLMNQKYICGIGNYLSHEILYRSKISPHRQINDFSSVEISRLYLAIVKLMKWSYFTQGGKYDYLPNVNVPTTDFKFTIYQKNECLKGKIRIDTIIKGRKIRWCPNIQK